MRVAQNGSHGQSGRPRTEDRHGICASAGEVKTAIQRITVSTNQSVCFLGDESGVVDVGYFMPQCVQSGSIGLEVNL